MPKEIKQWITVNGVHIPIFKDGSIGGPKALRDKVQKKIDNDPANKTDHSMIEAENKKAEKESNTKRYKEKGSLRKQQENEIKKKTKSSSHPLNDENFSITKRNGKYIASSSSKMNGVKDVEKSFNTKEEAEEHILNKMKQNSWTWNNQNAKDKAIAERYDKKVKEYEASKKEQTKEQKTISNNEDLKEKQIAKNKAEKEEANKQTKSIKLSKEDEKATSEYIKNNDWVHEQVNRELEAGKDWDTVMAQVNNARKKAEANKQTKAPTEQEMRDYLKSKGQERFVKELSGGTERGYKEALQYVYDQNTLSDDEFRKKYFGDNRSRADLRIETGKQLKKDHPDMSNKSIAYTTGKLKDDEMREYLDKKSGLQSIHGGPMSKEEAYMNYKAIKISKYMPKEKQKELKALKAKYYKIWKG